VDTATEEIKNCAMICTSVAKASALQHMPRVSRSDGNPLAAPKLLLDADAE
jgi:hypothetical protein